jgi:very-short-patch-repair endonuclease
VQFLRNDPALKDRRRELRRNQTEAEKTFWAHVRNRRFHGRKFFRQYSFGPYILDFYCPALKLAVELDGGHHVLPDARTYDSARSEYLHAHGIEVLRFWNHDVLAQVQSVLAKLEEKITPPSLPFAKGEER